MKRDRKFGQSLFAVPAVLGLGFMTPTPAYAALSVFGTPSLAAVVPTVVSTVAIGGTVATVGAATAIGGPKAGAVTGVVIVAGAVLVGVLDPADATFYNGTFESFFPSSLLVPVASGWLGDWGANPADPAPPTGLATFPAFDIQLPNAALTASVVNDLAAGTQVVTFDWGPSGHAETGSGDFNFYAVAFQATHDLLITDLGGAATPQPGANFYVDPPNNNGLTCSAPGSAVVINSCGDVAANNHSFAVRAVPEPSSWAMMLTGFGLLGWMMRRRRAGGIRLRGFLA